MEAGTYYILGIALVVLSGVWKVFQTQHDAVIRRLETLERDIVRRNEHEEMVRRLDGGFRILREQIKTIEETRPTTGVLEAVGNSAAAQITKLEDRVRSLEDNLRGRQ